MNDLRKKRLIMGGMAMMRTRRDVLVGMGATGLALGMPRAFAQGLNLDPALPAGVRSIAILDKLPGKVPLIKLAWRPPNFETPVSHFRTTITPNDAFFVRYHLADIPEVDAKSWRLKVGGEGAERTAEFTLDDLKDMPAHEVVAVCQCSGNRRGLFHPHVPGVEWGRGAMGNARWRGAKLKDVLDKAGLKKEAIEIVADGADKAVLDKTPDFVKSVPVWKAMEADAIVAYEMNGAPIPHWNGFPARLIIPGWTATYWVKHVTSLTPVTKPYDGFWMKSAYRIPKGKFPLVDRFISQETETNTPITEMVVNSMITSHEDGASIPGGSGNVAVSGIAWDGGYGIAKVETSVDGGKSWDLARLGDDLGRYSFRPWSADIAAPAKGAKLAVMARASNKIGQTQVSDLILNPPGYHHNVIQTITLVGA
jgi:DMSO/TMAO reductase YedYZ molybdopterin-dependent catalytic subunit